MKKIKINKEEAALEKEIENGEWVLVPDMENEINKMRMLAHHSLNKTKYSTQLTRQIREHLVVA